MATLTLDLPESVLAALRISPSEFPGAMRLAAAAMWYESGQVSQEVAAQIAGLCRTDFLLALAQMGRPSFHVDLEELDRELSRE